MDGPPDWDLLAVVRSCSSTTTTTTTTATTTISPPSDLEPSPPPPPPPPSSSSSSPLLQQIFPEQLLGFSTPFNTTSFQQELHDICKPLICTITNTTYNNINSSNGFQSLSCSPLMTSPVSSSSSVIAAGRSFTVSQQLPSQRRDVLKPSHVIFGASSPTVAVSRAGVTSHSQRSKKRKNLMKKVCHVPAEGLSSDMWAWRKYGQKPIKGSPYPRGYYRCSSSKGCLARKQVERNRSDPKMFIVTYTSEHNHPMPTHRNSLAGSTRQKPLTPTGTPPENSTCSSPSAASLSPLTELSESKTEGDEMGGLSDLMLNDDFFVGFEQIDAGSDDSDCFWELFSPSSEFPWLSNGGTTATAAGGS